MVGGTATNIINGLRYAYLRLVDTDDLSFYDSTRSLVFEEIGLLHKYIHIYIYFTFIERVTFLDFTKMNGNNIEN